MNEESLQTSFWLMVVVQTIGSVDMPGRGARKMPSPRQYVAIVVTWLVLMFIAGINDGAARATKAIGWVLVLVGMVIGPFGKRVISLFNTIATNFAPSTSTVAGQAATSAASTAVSGVQSAGQGAAQGASQ